MFSLVHSKRIKINQKLLKRKKNKKAQHYKHLCKEKDMFGLIRCTWVVHFARKFIHIKQLKTHLLVVIVVEVAVCVRSIALSKVCDLNFFFVFFPFKSEHLLIVEWHGKDHSYYSTFFFISILLKKLCFLILHQTLIDYLVQQEELW